MKTKKDTRLYDAYENYSKILSFPFPAIKYPPVYLSTDGYFFIMQIKCQSIFKKRYS